MKHVEYFRWTVTDESGRRTVSRWHMDRATARLWSPDAEPVPGTRELRLLPENDADHRTLLESAFRARHVASRRTPV